MMQNRTLRWDAIYWSTTVLLSAFMVYQLYLATTWGAGLATDSVAYLEGARNLLEHGNFKKFGTHYPPLYSVLIALSTIITGDIFIALRWLQIVTVAINSILFSYMIWSGTQRSFLPTVMGTLVFVTSTAVLSAHTMALSESAFCLLALLGFYFLANYLAPDHPKRLALALSAVCIGLALMTRYVGITLLAAGQVALWLYSVGPKRKRIADCLYFGLISLLPMLLWMASNWLTGQGAASRQLAYHPISMAKIQSGIGVLCHWLFIPARYPLLLLVILILLAGLYAMATRYGSIPRPDRTAEICFIFILVYIPFLIVSISFFDAHTPLDPRILFPVYLFFFLGLILLCHRIYHARHIQKISYVALALLFVIALAQAREQRGFLEYAKHHGIEFASKAWVQSETLRWVKTLPRNTTIYTNGPDAIKVITGRSSDMIPMFMHPVNRMPNDEFAHEINRMAANLAENAGVIVYFNTITWRWYLPTVEQLGRVLPLKLVYQGKDGVAVRINQDPQEALVGKRL